MAARLEEDGFEVIQTSEELNTDETRTTVGPDSVKVSCKALYVSVL